MATSIVYPGLTGSQTDFAVPFEYLSRDHVKVTLDGVATTSFDFLSDSLIQMDAAPTGELRVYRETPLDASLVTWTDGSILLDDDLNLGNLQTLFVAEELKEAAMAFGIEGHWDATNLRLKNILDPTDDQDAVTLGYLNTNFLSQINAALSGAQAAQTAAQTAENAALGYANASATNSNAAAASATSAANSQNSAWLSKGAAETARDAAEGFRDEAEGFRNQAQAAAASGLPEHLDNAGAPILTDANTALESGWYRCGGTTANVPVATATVIEVNAYNGTRVQQFWYHPVDGTSYRRTYYNSIWSAWERWGYTQTEGDSRWLYEGVHNHAVANQAAFVEPAGGNLYLAGAQTGAIQIILPTGFISNFMLIEGTIYNYLTNTSMRFSIGGYTFSGTETWFNTHAYLLQSPNDTRNIPVRWGKTPSGTPCVWIGDTAQAWSFPNVTIDRVSVANGEHSNVYKSGWDVNLVTAFDTVQATNNNTRIGNVPQVFTEFYESPPSDWAPGAVNNYTHGLSGPPKLVQIVMKCINAQFGYVVGEEVVISSDSYNGVGVWFDAQHVSFRSHANGIYTYTPTTLQYLNTTNFDVIVRAWR